MNRLDPPRPSRRLFWAIVVTSVGLFTLGALSSVVLRVPTETLILDERLLRTVLLEGLLAAAWVPVLIRRGWSLDCVTIALEPPDLVRGAVMFVASCLAYWFAFALLAVTMPSFLETARRMQIGGSPSWLVIALVSVVNPIAEEFLCLGFVANVLKSDGIQLALMAGVVARAAPHIYQGPAGVVSAVVLGLVFGGYYLWSGRLWPVVLAHGLADFLAFGHLAGGAA